MAVVKKISELTPKGSNLANNDLLIVGVDNGTDYDLKSVTGAELLSTAVSQTITNGVTTSAPSQNAVYDALDLKVDKVTGSRLITSAESTVLGNTSGTNSGDETVTTIKSKLGITTLSGSNTGDQDLSGLALDNSVVKLTGNQTIAGEKTFSSNTVHDLGLKIKHGTSVSATGYTGIGANLNNLQIGVVGATQTLTFPTSANYNFTFPNSTGTLALTSDLISKVDSNAAITGATKTKITYDSKGLVTSGTDATTSDIADSTNKRYVTDAQLTVLGNTSGTNTGDQDLSGLMVKANNLSDLTNTATARTNIGLGNVQNVDQTNASNLTSGTVNTARLGTGAVGSGLKYLADDNTWKTVSSGGSSGVWGIANSSGVYTYYATWALAIAAATSGQCIELFADITENTTTLILKDGVNVNGNGHTLTHNFLNHGFTDNGVSVQCSINNLTLNKSNSPYYAVSISNGSTNINGNAVFKGTQGIVICSGKINGFTIIGGYCLELNASTSIGSRLNVYCTTGSSVILTNGAKLNNSYVNSLGATITVTSGELNNCNIYVNGGNAVSLAAGSVNNCSVISVTNNAINSSSNTIISGGSFVSIGQIIGFIAGYANNAYFRSNANDGIVLSGTLNNCIVISDLYSPVISSGAFKMYNSEIYALNNGVNNHGITGITASSYVVGNMFIIGASATAIQSGSTPTVYLSGNSVKGSTNFKSAGIVNGQTNTADAQGNIILN